MQIAAIAVRPSSTRSTVGADPAPSTPAPGARPAPLSKAEQEMLFNLWKRNPDAVQSQVKAFFESPLGGQECPEGYEEREFPAGSGVFFCVNKETDCIIGYELVDPKDKSKGCVYKYRGQDCTVPGLSEEPFVYNDKGECVPKRLYKGDITSQTAAGAAAAEPMWMMGAKALAVLALGWFVVKAAMGGGGRAATPSMGRSTMRRRYVRRR